MANYHISVNANIGSTTPPRSLSTTSGTHTWIYSPITTAGAITFGGPVDILDMASITSNSSDITFNSTINGDFGLSLTAGGSVVFNGAVGNIDPLTDRLFFLYRHQRPRHQYRR